jgi:hypothetical protein
MMLEKINHKTITKIEKHNETKQNKHEKCKKF